MLLDFKHFFFFYEVSDYTLKCHINTVLVKKKTSTNFISGL